MPAILGALTAGLMLTDSGPADVAFVEPDRLPADAADVYAIAPSAGRRGLGDAVPDGVADYVSSVRPQPDKWPTVHLAADSSDPCLPGATRARVVELARDRASELGAGDGARVLTTADWTTSADWLDALFVPLGGRWFARHRPQCRRRGGRAPDEPGTSERPAQMRAIASAIESSTRPGRNGNRST